MLEFSYKKLSNERLMVFLKDKTSYSIEDEIAEWDEVETIAVDNGTFFIQNQLWTDGEVFFRGLIYTNPESPWDLFLFKHDLFSSITYEDVRNSQIGKQIFYSKPFVITKKNKESIMVSLYLLVMTFADGLYWLVRDYFRNNNLG